MKSKNDQLDFDFSRQIDIQRNVNTSIIDNCVNSLLDKENVSSLFIKHLRLMVLELFLCWSESRFQFLSVSMSKRGYNSRSRYNPNNVSSYLIRTIKFLQKKKLIEFYPGFFDSRTKKSRLSRIRASQILIDHFNKINFFSIRNFNHLKREFVLIYDKGKLFEYPDSYETNEIAEVIKYYNTLISKNLFDIPDQHEEFLMRTDSRKIVISNFSSCSYSYNYLDPMSISIDGCWWNKLDFYLSSEIKNKLIINHESTSHFSFYDFFGEYLSKISNTNIILRPKTFSSILNFEQLCYLIIKSFRSINNKSFMRSVLIEKKKLNLCKFTNDEVTDAVLNNIINNRVLTPFNAKKVEVKWEQFLSKCFFFLIKKLKSVNIPIYLVSEKIYFPSDKESLVLEKIEEILSVLLELKSMRINCFRSDVNNFKRKGLFARFRNSDKTMTKRYLTNKEYIGIG